MNDAQSPRPAAPPRPAANETVGAPTTDRNSPPAPAGAPPERVGRYAIRRLLGRGGMGAVYLAHDLELDRPVALKVPRLSGPDAEERFLREARAAAAVDHPNLCPVHDVGRADGVPYLAMAYVPGSTLARELRNTETLPIERAAAIAIGIARGMAEAHRHGIVHRDLKPGNVLLNAKGEPVVTDFGLARRSGTTESAAGPGATLAHDPRLTQAGAIMGTPAYMSPEQARGEVEKVGPAADVYALGAILYELLTGYPPFEADTVPELLHVIVTDEPMNPSEERAGVPPRLDAIVRRALEKDPDDRFESMDEFAEALASFAAPAPPPRPRRWLPIALAAALALVAVAAGAVVYIQTDNGTVEVRLKDPGADVTVSVDGDKIEVTDRGRITKLRAGPHALEVKGPDFETETQVFRVKRGEKTIIEIELKPRAKPAPAARPPKPSSPQPDPNRAALARLLARGRALIGQARYAELKPIAEQALALDPQSPGALALRATYRATHNDPDGALKDAEAALKLNPTTFQALLVRGYVHSRNDRHDEAIADATAAIGVDPTNSAIWANRSWSYHAKKEHRQAVADATRAIELGFTRPDALVNRASAHAFLGEHEKALADYTAVIRLDPNNWRALSQRSALHDKMGNRDAAAADWAAAKKVAPALELEERLVLPDPPKPPERKKLTPEDQAKFDKALAAAESAWAGRQYDACRKAIDEAVRIDPTSAPARALRARLLAQTGGDFLADANETIRLDPTNPWGYSVRGHDGVRRKDYAASVADNTIAITLDPANAPAWNNRGYAYGLRGQYHQALADFNEALRLQPTYSHVYHNRGMCDLHLGEYEKALADFRKATAAQPTEPRWPMYCSAIRAKLGDNVGAEADRKLAIERGWDKSAPALTLPPVAPPVKRDPELDPDPKAAAPEPDPKRARLAQLLASGKLLVRKGHQADLEPVVEEALKIDPQSPGALALRATLRQAKNDAVGARADADAALKLNPETVQALVMRSQLAGLDGKLDEDIAFATCVLRLDPNHGVAWSNRASGYVRKGEHRQAIADATRAIEFSRGLVSPYLTRGEAHAALGDYEKALADYDAAEKIAPGDPRVFVRRSAVFAKMREDEKAAADWKTAEALSKRVLPLQTRPVIPDPPKPPERMKLSPEEKTELDRTLAAFRTAWEKGSAAASLKAAEEACRIDPTSATARSARARTLAQLKRFKEALAEANEALRLDPEDAWAHATRGAVKADADDMAGAIADHTIALRIDPALAQAWDARGFAYMSRGQYHQAVADLTEAIRLWPGANRYQLRGESYLHLGEYAKALADYERAADLAPLDARPRMMCATLRGKLDDPGGAAKDRARALALDKSASAPVLPNPLPPVKRDPETEP